MAPLALTPASTGVLAAAAAVFAVSYLVGSIPWAYIIVRRVTGEDVTEHGSGNVGAMNVRRTTESWGWFVADMLADALKGIVPVIAASMLLAALTGGAPTAALADIGRLSRYAPFSALAMFGAVIGHNWSLWLSILKRRAMASGKGLATGGGALLVYDWRYVAVGLAVALALIALTRYSMAGQVGGTVAVPLFAVAASRPDWPLMVLLAAIVYSRHHRRFAGMLRGEEPKLYIHDRQGPRG
jgi:acyl phosphate:glycerol-3-phosphate acyltransferase